ncbi:MAG: DNA replication and repair protein RecF [Thermoleophilaceae bacterium]
MKVTRLRLRDFRNHERLELELGRGLTLVCGPNGAGKTNLLEGIYFGLTARSCRTANERELPRRGEVVARVEVETRGGADGTEQHLLEVGLEPGALGRAHPAGRRQAAKQVKLDAAPVDSPAGPPARPPVSVFLPERLELVKGPPSGRRAHLDQVVVGLWPSRAGTRSAYSRALAQRNALLGRIRAGAGDMEGLDAWDAELARHGVALASDRALACERLTEPFGRLAQELGLPGPAELRYRPRSQATDPEGLAAELAERRHADLERGFTAHGPHRDELLLRHDGEALRGYGAQGQPRTALLALLFAERELFLAERGDAPLMLLDDVMSELDGARRERLAELVRGSGQTVITTTEAANVPGSDADDVTIVELQAGSVVSRTEAAAVA